MDPETLRPTLLALLEEEMGETFEGINDDTDLRDDLHLDSVDLVSLLMQVQTRFGIRLETEELEGVSRVGDLLDLLSARIAQTRKAA
jgi:acyl carrier protein